jgi:hypothetical protein
MEHVADYLASIDGLIAAIARELVDRLRELNRRIRAFAAGRRHAGGSEGLIGRRGFQDRHAGSPAPLHQSYAGSLWSRCRSCCFTMLANSRTCITELCGESEGCDAA